jgi:hypothetical protein
MGRRCSRRKGRTSARCRSCRAHAGPHVSQGQADFFYAPSTGSRAEARYRSPDRQACAGCQLLAGQGPPEHETGPNVADSRTTTGRTGIRVHKTPQRSRATHSDTEGAWRYDASHSAPLVGFADDDSSTSHVRSSVRLTVPRWAAMR